MSLPSSCIYLDRPPIWCIPQSFILSTFEHQASSFWDLHCLLMPSTFPCTMVFTRVPLSQCSYWQFSKTSGIPKKSHIFGHFLRNVFRAYLIYKQIIAISHCAAESWQQHKPMHSSKGFANAIRLLCVGALSTFWWPSTTPSQLHKAFIASFIGNEGRKARTALTWICVTDRSWFG